MTKSVVLADPRGFCAGVDRAILTVQTILKAAEASGKRTREDGLPPVYVRRQIVHNKHVVEDLAGQGAVFVQELAEIPDAAAQAGIPVVFSAHGVSPVVKAEAERRGMHVVDATCLWWVRCTVRCCVSCARGMKSSISGIKVTMKRRCSGGEPRTRALDRA